MTLKGVVKHSPDARLYLKKRIFGNLAIGGTKVDGVDEFMANQKSADSLAMEPEGPNINLEPRSLRTLLLKTVLTLRVTLKSSVSEFLYNLCEKDTHEYIRLCGFGCAVGLLADKGLPGFAGLAQQAVDMDKLMKSGKKL